jgi:hypothetical protein
LPGFADIGPKALAMSLVRAGRPLFVSACSTM